MSEQTDQIAWHAQKPKDVLEALSTSKEGLSEEEVKERLEEYGPNSLPEKKPRSRLRIFMAQFENPLMIILVLAAAVSVFLLEWLDAGVIGAAILLNAVLGFYEEYKADKSLRALKEYLPVKARVRREGEIETIDVKHIVPGDIVMYASGDKVTADGRVITTEAFEVSEAALTGESTPVKKHPEAVDIGEQVGDRTSMVFAGTVATGGNAHVVITATGEDTELGRITTLVSEMEDEKTPLQQKLAVLARIIGISTVALAGAVFLVGVLQGLETVVMFQIAIALVVSAIPEGLVVAVTVILAIGMQRILKRKALVRRLVAAETLGSVSVICADKTGTLTTGEMTVDEVRINGEKIDLNVESEAANRLLAAVLYTNDTVEEKDEQTGEKRLSGSSTEIALYKYVRGKSSAQKEDRFAELPFDSERKYAAAAARYDGEKKLFAVGAPDILIDRADVSDKRKSELVETFNEMVGRGLRVLAATQSADPAGTEEITDDKVKDLHFLGFIGLLDPLRKEAPETIAKSRDAGLLPVMITGDHPETAVTIAKRVGLAASKEALMTGEKMDEISDDELFDRLPDISVYARVAPKHKVRIVNQWQKRNESVAMTGDGVNDAPAIKAADIGVALGSGTEVAKETADMVLLDNNFKTIVAAIREGRIIFDNIRKTIVYLLADSFSEIILVIGALIFSFPLPILPARILWINLITDGFPAAALTFEPGEKGIMKEPPRKKDEPILNKEMLVLIFIVGIVVDLGLFAIFLFLLGIDMPIEEIRTFIFVALGIDSLFYVFAVRKFRVSIFRSNPLENKHLVVGVMLGFLLLLLPVALPPLREAFSFTILSPVEWLALVGLAVVKLMLIELVKELFSYGRRKRKRLRSAQNKV